MNKLKKSEISNFEKHHEEWLQNQEFTIEELGLEKAQEWLYNNCKDKIDFSDWIKMEQVKLGLENGLTTEQILVYADEKYNVEQMKELRLGLENGLTEEQVKMLDLDKESDIEKEEVIKVDDYGNEILNKNKEKKLEIN